MKKLIVLFLGLAVLVIGCNTSKKMARSRANLTRTHWQLIELMGKPLENNDKNKELYIQLNKEDKKLTAFGGCNQITGIFEAVKANHIAFLKMASTKKACIGMESETKFLKMLEVVDNYSFEGNILILNDAGMKHLAKFKAVQ